ncbi:MAG: hypothetical protein BRD37_07735 [Bacteroidetes bacterium QH_8_67_23]|nr:MAG: hypothetical protein BRD37_07735 [Bacteroidetes bacterium QH_8_67_23]
MWFAARGPAAAGHHEARRPLRDAGPSKRVFGRIASFMSRPEHRGRIPFFLVAARPDLVPVDLKRQGRAEEPLQAATDDFAPPTYPDEIELQELAAALECTRRLMLPERFRAMDRREAARRLQRLKA